MDFVTDILVAFLLQVVFTIGIIVGFGLLIAFCNRLFYSNFKRHAVKVSYITGFIGTPVHELSHALFCVIFGHKIVDIKLFDINPQDGVLGYVHHTYNKRNIYQRIGNFFIGIAPILVISAILYLIACFLLPSFTAEVNALPRTIQAVSFTSLIKNIGSIVAAFFSLICTWQWWLFFVIGFFLALHMTLSRADIKGALSGLVFLLAVILAADIILEAVSSSALSVVTGWVISAGGYLLCIMLISLIISLMSVAVSFIFKKIIK